MAITLNQPFFTVTNKTLFEPAIGSRMSYAKLVQNPTSQELKQGIYKPHLTLMERKNRQGVITKSLRIEFSAPKLLFGNNFQEVIDADFEAIVKTLLSKLEGMGISTNAEWLKRASISAIHYSKNLILTDHTTPSYYLAILSKGNYSKTFDLNSKEYRNGSIFKLHCNNHEIVWYDKKADLLQATKSERRAYESDNYIQLSLLKQFPTDIAFEVLRFEIRLGNKAKIRHTLGKLDLLPDLSFQSLFDSRLSKRLLLYYLDFSRASCPSWLSSYDKPLNTLYKYVHICKKSASQALMATAFDILAREVGFTEVRQALNKYDSRQWYKIMKLFKSLGSVSTQSDPLLCLQQQLIQFAPVRSIDINSNMLNNDKYLAS